MEVFDMKKHGIRLSSVFAVCLCLSVLWCYQAEAKEDSFSRFRISGSVMGGIFFVPVDGPGPIPFGGVSADLKMDLMFTAKSGMHLRGAAVWLPTETIREGLSFPILLGATIVLNPGIGTLILRPGIGLTLKQRFSGIPMVGCVELMYRRTFKNGLYLAGGLQFWLLPFGLTGGLGFGKEW